MFPEYIESMEEFSSQPVSFAQADYERRCLETLETALFQTPMYESWKPLDPGPENGMDARYHSLPVLTKADIRAHFPYGLVPRGLDLDAALAKGEVSFVHTSGTADEALENIWNQQWWNASESASWTLNSAASASTTGTHREAILASALSVGPRSEKRPLGRERRMLGRFLFLNEFGTPAEWPRGHEHRILKELADYQPAVLEANPSLIARLARYAWKTGTEVCQPPLITLTYEFVSSLQLRAIRRVFRSPIASSYGSTEAGYVFMECEHGRFHQNAEFCRVDFAPLGDSIDRRVGRIFVTNFGNKWTPLMRFDIGDVVRIASGPCPCGRNLGMTLSSIEGRLKSICVADNGRLITHREIDEALSGIDSLEQYSLVQEDPTNVSLAFVCEGGYGKQALRDSAEVLNQVFGSRVNIQAREVHAILPERSGKFLLVKRNFPLHPSVMKARTEVVHG